MSAVGATPASRGLFGQCGGETEPDALAGDDIGASIDIDIDIDTGNLRADPPDDVAEILADIALAPPLNGTVEIAGPETIGLNSGA